MLEKDEGKTTAVDAELNAKYDHAAICSQSEDTCDVVNMCFVFQSH